MLPHPSEPTPRPAGGRHVALRIAGIYLILAGAYILFSDWLLAQLLGEGGVRRLSSFQTAKGLAFILVSALLLWAMIRNGVRQIRGSADRAERNRQWFETFMQNLPGVAFLKDRKGRYVFANAAAMRAGLSEDPIGKTDQQVLPPEVAEELRRNDQYVIDNRRSIQRIEHVPQDGQTHYWLMTKFPVPYEAGEIAVGGIGVDVTERVVSEQRIQALNAELQEANGLKDQFLAVMSHELRTPITAIRLWAQLLRDGDPAGTREAIEMIEQSAAVQAQLIEDLLDVSRIITGRLRVDLRPIDPLPPIEAAINAVRPSAEAQGLELRVRLLPQPSPAGRQPASSSIIADPKRIQQMAWNLLTNAIKFTARGGRVDVIVECRREPNPTLVLTVADTGKGISAEFLPHLFEHFRQADTSTTRRHGGLGIGLSIVRHMVKLHHGTIQAHSDGEGKGATFTIELPLCRDDTTAAGEAGKAEPAQQQQPSDLPAAKPGRPLEGIRIVLTEDQADARLAMQALLRQAGAQADSFETAQGALDAVRRTRPDILLSDIAMPEQDGIWLIRQLRADPAGDRLRAGAISAYALSEDRDRALDAGFDDYLVKPIQGEDLIRFVLALRGTNRW